MTERLEQVEVVVAARCVALAAAWIDVVYLELASAHAARRAAMLVTRERALAREAPEVVGDEVGSARIAAPAPPPRGQRATTPRTHAIGIDRGFAALGEQAIDLGHARAPGARLGVDDDRRST